MFGVTAVYLVTALQGGAESHHDAAALAFILTGSAVGFVLLISLNGFMRRWPDRTLPWVRMGVLLVLIPALSVVGSTGFILLLALLAQPVAVRLPTRTAAIAVVGITALAGALAWFGDAGLVLQP